MHKINSPEGPRVTIRVESYVYEKLKQEAKQRGVPLAALFRTILTHSVTKLDPKHEEIVGRLVHLEEEISMHRRITCAALSAVSQLDTALTKFHESDSNSLQELKANHFRNSLDSAIKQGDELNTAISKGMKNTNK